MVRCLLLAGLSLTLLTACGVRPSDVESLPRADATPSSHAPAPSTSAKGLTGRTVASYFWPPKAYPGPPWTKDGRAVSEGVLNSFAGPDHCGWQTAVMMHVGWPLGTVSQHFSQTHQFIRDPDGVMGPGLRERLVIHTDLPADAVNTGYRTGDLELWLSPSNPDAYLKVDNDVERWPYVEEPEGCK